MAKDTSPDRQRRSNLRAERRDAAIVAAQRRRRLAILGWGAAAAVAVAAILIIVNLPDRTSGSDIDFSSIPQDGMTLGDPAAPVTLVEYADFQCPACGNFATTALPHVVYDFVRKDQVKVEFHPFPFLGGQDLTDPNNESVNAAMAASCASDQGKFWEYNHTLFASQDGENQGGFAPEKLKGFASDLGLDQQAFNTCFDSGEKRQSIIDGYNKAVAAGVTSTPTLLINGAQVNYTTQGYPKFKEQIEAVLAGETNP